MKKILQFTLLSLVMTLGFSTEAWGQENIIPVRTDVSGFSSWTDANVAGTTYLQLLRSTSQTISPAMDFDAYTNETLTFTARTFGGTNPEENEIFVSISTDNGATWIPLGSRTPINNTLNLMTHFDLSTYNGTQVRVRFSVAGTNNSIGAGIDDIQIQGVPAGSNLPSLTTSVTSLPSFGEVTVGTSSVSQNFTVTGENLVENVVVNAPANFEISTDDVNFTNQLTLTPTAGEVNTVIYARFSPLSTGLKNGDITLVSGSLNRTVAVTGTGVYTIGLTNNGYTENFSTFDSYETLPLGWAVSNTSYLGDWGTGTSAGLRGNSNVLGFQHTGSSGTFTASSTYTNNTGEIITDLLISYLGRVQRTGEARNPIWTVSVAGNVVAALSYDTAVNQDQLVSSVVSGLNIPVGANFTIEFSSQRGGTTGSSKQIGIGDFSIQLVTIWNGFTWSNGEPTITKNAIIQGDYTTTSDLEALSLTVDSGIFTIASGTTVTVAGAVVNNAVAANFVIANNGNLVQNNDDANVGAITVHSNSQPLMRLDYTLWSSPVAGQNLKAFSPNTLTSRFYVYDETAVDGNTTTNNGTYVTILNGTNEATYAFEAAQGYLIRTPNNHPTTPTIFEGQFVGMPHNGNYTIPVSAVNAGYNLVGNPYPSSLDLDAFFTANTTIENTVWFWRKTNGAAGPGYITANNLGYTYPNETADSDTNIAIRSGQGFFVKATTAGNVQFTNAMRSNNTTNPFFRNATTSESPSRVWLELTHNNEVLASSLIGYTSQATIGIDSGFDSKPFGGSAALVSLIGSEGFAIQGRPTFEDTDQVDLGFEAGIAGDYSIALANKDGIFTTGQAVYLKDLTTNTTHDLTSGPYSFATPIGIFNSRFQLVYQNGTLGTTTIGDAANSYVITSNNIITIGNAYEKIESVVIYDIQGRELARKTNVNAHALEVSSITQKNQVLVVAITTTTGVATKKVLF